MLTTLHGSGKHSGRGSSAPGTVLFILFYLFTYFVFLPLLEPLPWHMEVPRLGVKSEL